MLKVENFSFAFAEEPVLKNIGFMLNMGQYLSIIGPNGAGKSTLLKCLMRLHDRGRSTGRIEVKGRPLEDYGQKELARIISYVPQAGGWTPPFTVMELLRLSRFPYATSTSGLNASDYEAVNQALELTGLKDMAKRYLKTMSGGERQKAYLAAALAQGAEIMLLDEPASFLDPRHAAELNALLRGLNRDRGLTMITVTHDLNHPLSLGGPVLVLKEGRLLFFGAPQELLAGRILEKAYQHEFFYLTHPHTGCPVILAE